MAGVTIEVSIDDREVRELLSNLLQRTRNLAPAMKIVGEIIRTSVVKNFEYGGRPRWRPSRRALRSGGKTLIASARLMKSIKAKAYPDRAEVGTNLIYAAIHQFGGWAGRGYMAKIPARPFLMVQDVDWQEIKKALADYLMEGGRKR